MKSRTTSIFSHIFVKNQLNFSKKLFSNKINVSNLNISNKSSVILSTPYNSFFMKNSRRHFSSNLNFTQKRLCLFLKWEILSLMQLSRNILKVHITYLIRCWRSC